MATNEVSILKFGSTEYSVKDDTGTASNHKHTKSQITDFPDISGKADLADIAPAFSESVDYGIGDYVTYEGDVYRFKMTKSAGTWNTLRVTKITAVGQYVTAGKKANTALGTRATAEGSDNTASAAQAHAEGYNTTASGNSAHAEGNATEATGDGSHAEGYATKATGAYSHAEGISTEANSNYSHAGGYADGKGYIKTENSGDPQTGTISATGAFAHGYAFGDGTNNNSAGIKATNEGAVALGSVNRGFITASGAGALAEGNAASGTITAASDGSFAGGYSRIYTYIKAEDTSGRTAKGAFAHGYAEAEEDDEDYPAGIEATADGAIAMGYAWAGFIKATAPGAFAHGATEGDDVIASGYGSTAMGRNVEASGGYSVAMSVDATASGQGAVAESGGTASGVYSHAESDATASGDNSHAERYGTASGHGSHAGGLGTIAQRDGQTVIGQYNIADTTGANTSAKGDYAFIIGNGTSNNARSNALGVKWDGTHEINGDVVIGQHYDSTQSADVDSNLTVSGIVTVNGSDYAEKFEEAEPCPVNRFVTLDGEKIRLAQSDDDYILGVTSEKPAIIGDKDNDGVAVGLIGKLWVVHDGSAKVNGFVVSGKNGIAIAMENMVVNRNLGYRVMAVDGNRCKILVK